ncbi:MAG: elongation factor P [Verrucomicrobiota bacterium]|nr:elongation factor P [Limisphaera sp.]MDW8382924.1 elongation factor P [Verrucomicrobiota bacterium]
MQTVLPSEFKKGMVLLIEGVPHAVEELHVTGTAQTKHKIHARLRHLKTGRFLERTFTDVERVPVAEVQHRTVQYSYNQGEQYVFLDTETYDEVVLTNEQVGDRRVFLKENEEYRALFLDGKILDIVLPPQVTLTITETAPPIRGGSDSTWKPAVLETGLEIMVPLFLDKGERVRVDTATRKYVGKESDKKT